MAPLLDGCTSQTSPIAGLKKVFSETGQICKPVQRSRFPFESPTAGRQPTAVQGSELRAWAAGDGNFLHYLP